MCKNSTATRYTGDLRIYREGAGYVPPPLERAVVLIDEKNQLMSKVLAIVRPKLVPSSAP